MGFAKLGFIAMSDAGGERHSGSAEADAGRPRARVLPRLAMAAAAILVLLAASSIRRMLVDYSLVLAVQRADSHSAIVALRGGANPNTRVSPVTVRQSAGLYVLSRFLSTLRRSQADRPAIIYDLEHATDKVPEQRPGLASSIAAALLEHGADPNSENPEGQTAFALAANDGLSEVEGLLVEHGVDCNAADEDGRTPLMMTGSIDVARLLVQRGANVNWSDREGTSVLQYALFDLDPDRVRLVLSQHPRVVQDGNARSGLLIDLCDGLEKTLDRNWRLDGLSAGVRRIDLRATAIADMLIASGCRLPPKAVMVHKLTADGISFDIRADPFLLYLYAAKER